MKESMRNILFFFVLLVIVFNTKYIIFVKNRIFIKVNIQFLNNLLSNFSF